MRYVPHDPYQGSSPDEQDVVLDYWDLVQVRYHMLRALKILQGEGLTLPNLTPVEHAMWELKLGHKLNNHLMAEIEHVREE